MASAALTPPPAASVGSLLHEARMKLKAALMLALVVESVDGRARDDDEVWGIPIPQVVNLIFLYANSTVCTYVVLGSALCVRLYSAALHVAQRSLTE